MKLLCDVCAQCVHVCLRVTCDRCSLMETCTHTRPVLPLLNKAVVVNKQWLQLESQSCHPSDASRPNIETRHKGAERGGVLYKH